MSQLKAAFLDYASLDQNDLDFRPLNAAFSELQLYDATSSDQVLTRLTNVEVAIVNKVVLSAETIQQLPKLKLILISATGTNNVDLKAAPLDCISPHWLPVPASVPTHAVPPMPCRTLDSYTPQCPALVQLLDRHCWYLWQKLKSV